MLKLKSALIFVALQSIWAREGLGGRTDFCENIPDELKFDCHFDVGPLNITAPDCHRRQCCWGPTDGNTSSSKSTNVPLCYYNAAPPFYYVVNQSTSAAGVSQYDLKTDFVSPFPVSLPVTIVIYKEDTSRIRIQSISNPLTDFHVPVDIPQPRIINDLNPQYSVAISNNPFYITIKRIETNAIIFDMNIVTAPFLYADDFIQISTRLASPLVYGLGEHQGPLLKNASNWERYVFWNSDQAPADDIPLYGSHPFLMNIEDDGKAHGILFLNSNSMDVDLQPLPSATFRTIGGVIDMVIFLGDSPLDVIQQYTKYIGRSPMPPFWALGFHLCRWGYNNDSNLQNVIDRNRAINIPYDVQWSDIDHMDEKKDFTVDPVNYKNLPNIVKNLHDNNQKYIIILDPAISSEHAGSYSTYDKGVEMDVFIKDERGQDAIGEVWPGKCVFPDFGHPNSTKWWSDEIKNFHNTLQFDSLWIDMNEPSNFVNGSIHGCPRNKLNYPSYAPGNQPLFKKTLCPSFPQYQATHYYLHNLYGLQEANATRNALNELYPNKRSIIISRANYPTAGVYAGHWTGDIASTWQDLQYSISSILEFQFYGINLVGADVCGFRGDTTEELCVRWMQVGSFYPFMRNHNDLRTRDQDPAVFSVSAQNIMRNALNLRYSLLPYMYTQFFYANRTGNPVIWPLFMAFPNDKNTYNIDRQFLWYNNVLVSPVLDRGARTVSAYLPKALWYDLGGHVINSNGQFVVLDAPLEKINVHIRGGSVITFIEPNVTTTLMRDNAFNLFVALDEGGSAEGDFYWDDGESRDWFERPSYDLIRFICAKNTFNSIVLRDSYQPTSALPLSFVSIYGVSRLPDSVTLNGSAAYYTYSSQKRLTVFTNNVSLLKPFTIEWEYY